MASVPMPDQSIDTNRNQRTTAGVSNESPPGQTAGQRRPDSTAAQWPHSGGPQQN
jgi:hypothetical protein